jgi:uncharacterized membrane protein SpoIIM required for sporulation
VTPLQFEAEHAPCWSQLEAALKPVKGQPPADGARLAALYRRVCEHLALAQARSYPIHLTQRLASLTQRAHRLIYRRQDHRLGLPARVRHFALLGFPQAVREHRWYLLAATFLFVVPLLVLAWATWREPGFILHLLDAPGVQRFEAMYGDSPTALGRERTADTDWQMFGFYIMNNIGVGFRCFAAGVFAGVGSAFFLVFNGLQIGAVAGYLVASGHAENFLSFVVTHGAFELTAIVLAGAAGLRLGYSWLAPGRLTRLEALKLAAGNAVLVIYGVVGMLVLAAAIEAFWSSARWIAPAVKYGVGALCWAVVLAYLAWQGRPRRAPLPASVPEKRAHAN